MRIKFPRKYDFMGQRAFIAAFVAGLLFAIVAVAVFGVQQGVEFTGGAEVALRYIDAAGHRDDPPDARRGQPAA